MVITYQFPTCWVHIDEIEALLQTVFQDGATLFSCPNHTKDPGTARAYGYGNDIWRLWREHDLLHHVVATLYGFGCSPTLWSVAHEDHPVALPQWARVQEEEFIAKVHLWLNHDLWHDDLIWLQGPGCTQPQLKAHIQELLTGAQTDARPLAPQ